MEPLGPSVGCENLTRVWKERFPIRNTEPEHREEDIHTEGQPGIEYQRLSGLRVMSVWGEWPSVRGQSHERMVKTYLQKGTEYQCSAA